MLQRAKTMHDRTGIEQASQETIVSLRDIFTDLDALSPRA
jgi:hypothetical protein